MKHQKSYLSYNKVEPRSINHFKSQKIEIEMMIPLDENDLTSREASSSNYGEVFSSLNSPSPSASAANPAEEAKDRLFSHLVKTLDEKDKVEETLLPFSSEAPKCRHVEPNHSLKTPVDTASH